jgi:hypothetical protein
VTVNSEVVLCSACEVGFFGKLPSRRGQAGLHRVDAELAPDVLREFVGFMLGQVAS